MLPVSLPNPSQGVWYLGPVSLRAYALSIIAGILAADCLAEKRWTERGGEPRGIFDIVLWAVPFGVVGGRLYDVLTHLELYFKADQDTWAAFYVWRGGLGTWGAIALGTIGAWIGARRSGVRLGEIAGVLAPAVPLAQVIGRSGNWFSQELFGRQPACRGGCRSRRTAGLTATSAW